MTHNGNHSNHNSNMEVDDEEETLLQIEDLTQDLCRPDAVIDPSIISTLRQFTGLSARVYGGEGDQTQILRKHLNYGQQLLKDNYCGYKQVCNLLLDWMKNVHDPKTINNTFIRILKESAIELHHELKEDNDGESTDNTNTDSKDFEQRIIKDIDEITKSYGDTTVKYHGFSLFEFAEKFKSHLNKILAVRYGSDIDYDRKCQRFVIYCCKNELHYLYSRRLLSELRQNNLWNKLDYAIANIENKLFEYTNAKNNNNLLLNNNNKIKELCVYGKGIEFSSELRVPFMELLRKGSFTKADITKVYNYYLNVYNSGKIVSLRFLQNEQMISYLYNVLFIPSKTKNFITKTYISQYIFLLNYSLFEGSKIDKKEFELSLKLLTDVTEICRDRNYGVTLSEDGTKQNILFSAVKKPGIAFGILIWINHCMFIKSETYFAENFETYLTPLLVSLVAEIATLHLFLRNKIAVFAYNMIYNIGGQTTSTLATKSTASFDAKTTSFASVKNMEVIKTMLNILIYIIQLGEYVFVFDIINKRPNDLIKLDRSLHRHFISQIIEKCCDPLPDEFVLLLCRLLKDNHIIAAVRNDEKTCQIVEGFVNGHKDIAPNDAQIILTAIKQKRQNY